MSHDSVTADFSNPSSTSSSLLERVKAHHPDAWERLVELYGAVIYGWCRQAGLQAQDAADIGQEVFAAVAAGIDGFRRDRPGDSFRGWLWGITQHKIHDLFRKQRGQAEAQGGTAAVQWLAQVPQPPETSASPLPLGQEGGLWRRAVELVRAGVEVRTWQAFWAVTVEGREPVEVAQALGISVQAVYDAKYRIRRRIRQELDGLTD